MSWQAILKTVAPTIATALGGPLAGAGTKFLAEKLLGNADASEAEIAQYIEQATPESRAKLREIDAQFKIEIHKLDTENYKTEVDDRKNARKYATDNTAKYLAIIIIIAFIALIFFIPTTHFHVEDSEKEAFGMLVGAYLWIVKSTVAFLYGYIKDKFID